MKTTKKKWDRNNKEFPTKRSQGIVTPKMPKRVKYKGNAWYQMSKEQIMQFVLNKLKGK